MIYQIDQKGFFRPKGLSKWLIFKKIYVTSQRFWILCRPLMFYVVPTKNNKLNYIWKLKKIIYFHNFFNQWNGKTRSLKYSALREKCPNTDTNTSPYFPAFGLNTDGYGLPLRIQSEYWKIRTRKNSVFRHFSHSAAYIVILNIE